MDRPERRRTQRVAFGLLLCLFWTAGPAGPASARGAAGADSGPEDPLESFNRAVFAFNLELDRFVLRPATVGYRTVVPKPIRSVIGNFLANLAEPLNAIHGALQGDARAVEHGLGRFVVNSILGVGGLFDIAGETGLASEPRSFARTLGTWGMGQGAYLVLPVLGPSSVRDAPAGLVDRLASPHEHALVRQGGDPSTWRMAEGVARALDFRDRNFDSLDGLLDTSLDPYVAARSAYRQLARTGGPDDDPFADDIFLDIDESDFTDEEDPRGR